MVTPATSAAAAKPKDETGSKKAVATVPFIRASMPWWQPTNIDVTKQITTSQQSIGSFDIPSNGFVRNVVILVTTSTAGSGGSGVTLNEDAPFNLLQSIKFKEPGGQEIGNWDSGYDLYLANKWGGYQNVVGADPRTKKSYSQFAATFASAGFLLRIPVELNARHGLGSLANQNAASTLRLEMSLAAYGSVASGGTPPTTMPTFRFRVFLELWGQPAGSADGMANQTVPPVAGTTQFWTTQYYPVNAGQQSIKLNRVGNYARNYVMKFTRTAGTRANGQSDWPEQTEIYYDTYTPWTLNKTQWIDLMTEVSGYGGALGTEIPANDAPGGLDNGVFVLPFTTEFDGTLGHENNDLWLPTKASSRIEIRGNFANAGNLMVMTNDVNPTGPVWG